MIVDSSVQEHLINRQSRTDHSSIAIAKCLHDRSERALSRLVHGRLRYLR
jgi:hypothetical protein